MNVKSYSKTKNNSSNGYSGSSSGSVTKSTIAESATKLATTHTFWGNAFNGTQDVEGDLKIKDSSKLIVNGESTLNTLVTNSTADIKGTLTAENGITDEGNLVVNGTTTLKEVTVDGSMNVNGKTYLQGTEINGAATISGNLSVTGASTLNGTVNCLGTLQSNNIDTKELSVTGKSIFNGQTTINNNLAVTGKTTMKDLEVTGEAHFYNMIIDEVKSVGGTIVISCANGEVHKVGKKLKYDTQGGYERLYLTYHYQDRTEIPNADSSTECYYIGLNRGSLLTDLDGWKTIFNNIFTKCSGTIGNDGNVTFTNGVVTTESLNSGKDTILIGLASGEQMILDNYSTLKEGIEYAASIKTKVVSYVNSSLKGHLINIKEFVNTKALNYVTTTRCLWKRGTSNQFLRGDQVLCHKFSIEGTTKHYWTPVINRGSEKIDDTIYEFVDLLDGFSLSGTVYNTINGYTVNCEVGDNLVQLGYATSGTTYRSNAIIISSYAENVIDVNMTQDEALQPPYLVQYTNINDYTLSGHSTNYFSRNKNKIKGDLSVTNGKTVEELIEEAKSLEKTYVYTAFCNNPSTGEGFTISPKSDIQYSYMSVITSISTTQPSDFASYTNWFHISGTETDITQYRLIPIETVAVVSTSDKMAANLTYQILEIKGTSSTAITSIDGHTLSVRAKVLNDYDYTYLTADSGYFSGTITKDDFSKGNLGQSISVELIIDNNLIATDSITITIDKGAYMEVTDKIKGLVTDIEGNRALIQANADSIRQEVSDREGAISKIETKVGEISTTVSDNYNTLNSKIDQTKDSINLEVNDLRDGISKTGINIKQGTITINTNNFYLKNQNGEKVLDADSEGNLEIKGVIKPLNLQMATKTFSIYATDDENMKTEDIKLVYLQNTESNSIYKITIESSSTINFEQYKHNVCTLTSNKAYNAKLTIDGVEKLNSALEADRVSDTAQTTNCETQHPQASDYYSISGTKFVFEGTLDDSKAKTYGLAYFYATFTDDNYRYHCILNLNNQGIASFTKTKTPIYGGDSTSCDSVTSNIDMTNLKVGYKSFAQVSGNSRVFGEIDNEFYANNSQEYYYYELGDYCSGIYDCTKRINGVEFGSYDATGKWITTVNDSKEIAVIYVLPSPSSYIYNEKYRGLEITFICSNYTKAYLAVDGYTSNSVLYAYSNGDWVTPKNLSNYNKKLSNLYKLQPGFNRVLCSYNATWYIENS